MIEFFRNAERLCPNIEKASMSTYDLLTVGFNQNIWKGWSHNVKEVCHYNYSRDFLPSTHAYMDSLMFLCFGCEDCSY